MRQRRARQPGLRKVSLTDYVDNPIGFGQDVLGESYTDDVKSVMESVRDYPVTIAKSANAVGKTHGAARVALWFYRCFPSSQVYTTAAPPEANLRRLLWGEIGALVQKHPGVFDGDKVNTLNIARSSQSFITGVSIPMAGTPEQREAKFSGKHAPNLLFIVDEGDAVPNEVYKGIESCMSGGNAKLLVMFNPRGAYGPVYLMEKERRGHIVHLSAFRHPNVLTGQDQIPGAVNRDKTVRRINEWTRPLAPDERRDDECFEVPDFLVGTTAPRPDGGVYDPLSAGVRKIINPSFYYMVLGMYPAQNETQLISRAWVDAAISRWYTYVARYGETPPTAAGIMGLDVAAFGKDFNVATMRWGGWVERPVSWNGVDPDATAIRASALYQERQVQKCFVDATGVGAGVAPRMTRLGCDAEGVMVASSPFYETEDGQFSQLRDQLWWSVREWLRRDSGAMLPPDEELAQELTTPLYIVRGGRIKVSDKDTMRELLGRSPDKADSLALTFSGDSMAAAAETGDNPFAGYRG